MNPIIAEAVLAKPKAKRHAMWCVHYQRKYRTRSLYVQSSKPIQRYRPAGYICPICGPHLNEYFQGVAIADLLQAEPLGAKMRASLRKLSKNQRRNAKAHPG